MTYLKVTIYLKSGTSFTVRAEDISLRRSIPGNHVIGIDWVMLGEHEDNLFYLDINEVAAIITEKIQC